MQSYSEGGVVAVPTLLVQFRSVLCCSEGGSTVAKNEHAPEHAQRRQGQYLCPEIILILILGLLQPGILN